MSEVRLIGGERPSALIFQQVGMILSATKATCEFLDSCDPVSDGRYSLNAVDAMNMQQLIMDKVDLLNNLAAELDMQEQEASRV